MKLLLKSLILLLLISLCVPFSTGYAAEKQENPFYNEDNCETYLSFWISKGEEINFVDKNNNYYRGLFNRFDKKTGILYFIEKEFEKDNVITSIEFSKIDHLELVKKRFNKSQLKQPIIISSLLGALGGYIISKSKYNDSPYRKNSDNFEKVLIGGLIGSGIGLLLGIVGNEKISEKKILDCD